MMHNPDWKNEYNTQRKNTLVRSQYNFLILYKSDILHTDN
jgi:hypothetical protein